MSSPARSAVRFLLFLASNTAVVACGGLTLEEQPRDSKEPEQTSSQPPTTTTTTPPQKEPPRGRNDRCASAERLVLTGGKLELTGDTSTSSDEFPALDCGSRGAADSLIGPQRYYELAVRRGRTYRFALTPSFHAVLYGFDATKTACNERAIRQACTSNGVDGFASGIINPGTGRPGATVFAVPPPFRAERDMTLMFVVDSDGASGSFILTITED